MGKYLNISVIGNGSFFLVGFIYFFFCFEDKVFDNLLIEFLWMFWLCFQSKYTVDEVAVEKKRKIGNTKMPPATVSTRTNRQALTERNGGGDLPPSSGPPSTAGSDCGVIEFTKESVEALLSERLKIKNKFNYKVSSFVVTARKFYYGVVILPFIFISDYLK